MIDERRPPFAPIPHYVPRSKWQKTPQKNPQRKRLKDETGGILPGSVKLHYIPSLAPLGFDRSSKSPKLKEHLDRLSLDPHAPCRKSFVTSVPIRSICSLAFPCLSRHFVSARKALASEASSPSAAGRYVPMDENRKRERESPSTPIMSVLRPGSRQWQP